MRQYYLRIALPVVALSTATALLSAKQIVIQAVPAQAAAKAVAADKPKTTSVEVMTFPSDRDAKNMIQAVKDYMKEYAEKESKAPWDRICQAAQQVLDAKSDSFFELPKASPESPQGRVSAKAEINRLIGEFPPAGRQFYQLAYGASAENLLAQSRNKNYDRSLLAEASQRYFHTKAGAQATLLLATLQLERGNYIEAAYGYERLLRRPDSEEFWTPLTTFKAIVAMTRAGYAPATKSLITLMEDLEKKFPRDGLLIGKRNYSIEELKTELSRSSESLLGSVSEAYVAMRYGNPSHTALLEGGKPFLDATWTEDMFYHVPDPARREGNTWVRQNLDDVLKTINPAKSEVAIPGFFPATSQNLAFIRNYEGVYAYITKDGFNNHGKPSRAGNLYWFKSTIGGAAALYGDSKSTNNPRNEGFRTEDIENNWRYYRDHASMKTLLFDNPLVGSLTHDGQSLYIIDDAALPPPPPNQNNEFGFMPVNPGAAATTPVKSRGLLDGSLLKSINMSSGNTQWILGQSFDVKPMTEEEEERSTNTLLLMQNSFFLGPPLPLNGKLYVLYERAGVIRLACLDPNQLQTWQTPATYPDPKDKDKTIKTMSTHSYPTLLWNQRLGEPNARLPGDTLRRIQCSYLTFADGVMICPTNAGAVVAVDIMSKSLLWARSYRTLKTTGTERTINGRVRIIRNNIGAANKTLPNDRWRAAAPIISQGRVVFAAYDSEDLYCLDLRTGEVIWKEPRKSGDLYIGGLVDDRVLIVGKDTMRALKLNGTPRKQPSAEAKEDVAYAWKDLKIGLPAGHGVTTKDGMYYLPVAWSADDTQPQVWAVDVARGEVIAKAAYRKKDLNQDKPMLGNLAFHEGQLYSQSATEFTAFPLIELKKQEMNRLLAANPRDPNGLLARGELLLDEGKLIDAIADFSAARTNDPSLPTRERLRDKLFVVYTELLRKDFAAGEKYLKDYESLCNVASDAEDPNIKLRQMEERVRRQRLYLELIARGREDQGRFTEAFDHYRAFAAFGGNKELVALSDEPNGKTRPDVWARGRIEAMIHDAKDDAARKSLEALVAREWDAVKDGKDLGKLRDFVGIFGQQFRVGAEAELLLGVKLFASDRDQDQREAHAVLTRLAATSEDPVLAARALESLARLATRTGQAETAVGYYSALGTKYADVVIRDGLTGADLYNDLLTDKRLLPFLEPARLPTPARIKAVKHTTTNNGYVQQGYVLEPDGAEHSPFFRRHRIMLANNDSGGGWVLRVYDRGSGEEKWKVTGLKMYNPTGNLNYRIAQARGSLLLLHLGVSIHCFDLAEKRKCWEHPVFGEGNRIDFNNVRFDANQDEELVITYNADGSKMTIGRTTILEDNYAAMITRDGLVAVDPISGSKLWTRTNISPSALIFGDARNIFIVETVGGKSTSKVLRAVDGTSVDGVPDFAAFVTGSNRVRIVGRNVLLSEGSSSKPLTLRLYDPLTGKNVWKKDYAPTPEPKSYKQTGLAYNGQAKLLKTYSHDLTGAFGRDGTFEVLNVHTGEVVFKGRIDEENAELHAGMTAEPVLLSDAERYYLVLNKTADIASRNNYYSPLRSLTVTGPMYCFEKGSGKRAWYTGLLFEGQQLITERFSEMPALVAATQMAEDNEDGGVARRTVGSQIYRVVVVDKVNGQLRLWEDLNTNNGHFNSLSTDPRTATAKLLRHDLNITITPDDGVAQAKTVKSSETSDTDNFNRTPRR